MNIWKKIGRKYFVDVEEIKKSSKVFKKIKKDEHLFKEPFYFKGNNGKAILLVHGWSSAPYSIRKLGEYLNKNGYTVFGPTLTGHGTKPDDLKNVKGEEWIKDVKLAYTKLAKEYEKVFIIGVSMGGSLALILAENNLQISGLVLLATPYRMKSERRMKIILIIMSWFKDFYKKYYPKEITKIGTAITPFISYQRYSVKNMQELLKIVQQARKKISFIQQPCFILQADNDHLIGRKSMKNIYQKINSQSKQMKYVYNSYHSFISDLNKTEIFVDILNFINSH